MSALQTALREARLAYQFAPGSYTFSALSAIGAAIAQAERPNWIEAFGDYALPTKENRPGTDHPRRFSELRAGET